MNSRNKTKNQKCKKQMKFSTAKKFVWNNKNYKSKIYKTRLLKINRIRLKMNKSKNNL